MFSSIDDFWWQWVSNIFQRNLKKFELKVECQGNHVSFLDFAIKVDDPVCVYKPFDKRDKIENWVIISLLIGVH